MTSSKMTSPDGRFCLISSPKDIQCENIFTHRSTFVCKMSENNFKVVLGQLIVTYDEVWQSFLSIFEQVKPSNYFI